MLARCFLFFHMNCTKKITVGTDKWKWKQGLLATATFWESSNKPRSTSNSRYIYWGIYHIILFKKNKYINTKYCTLCCCITLQYHPLGRFYWLAGTEELGIISLNDSIRLMSLSFVYSDHLVFTKNRMQDRCTFSFRKLNQNLMNKVRVSCNLRTIKQKEEETVLHFHHSFSLVLQFSLCHSNNFQRMMFALNIET